MGYVLESDRLFLRQFTSDDCDLIFDLDSDLEVTRYVDRMSTYGQAKPIYEVVQNKTLPTWLAYYHSDRYGIWAAIEKSSAAFVGWFALRPAFDYRYAIVAGYNSQDLEIGYRLKRSVWGQGYATEMAKVVVEYGLQAASVERVVAVVDENNQASLRVMHKIGLVPVGTWQHPTLKRPFTTTVLNRDAFQTTNQLVSLTPHPIDGVAVPTGSRLLKPIS